MFQGTMPSSAIKIINKIAKEWDCKRIYVGCSGNFTIERSLSNVVSCPITSNDVTIYSSYLGKFFAGESVEALAVKEEYKEEYGFLEEFMQTDADRIATMILAADMITYAGSELLYMQRMFNAYESQFPKMHAKMKKKVEEARTSIDEFYHGDVMDMLDEIGDDCGFISFPPFFKGGYEKMWKGIEEIFFYEEPKYELFDPNTSLKRFCEKVLSKDYFIICTEREVEEMKDFLCGEVQTNNGKSVYVYGKTKESLFIENRSKQTNARPVVKISEDDKITSDIEIKRLTLDQFNENRALYLSTNVKKVANPSASFGLFSNGKCFGMFGLANSMTLGAPSNLEGPSNYLLTDFSISPTSEKNLSKLVLICVLSKEVKLIAERVKNGRVKTINTNAFSNNPVSMKYRGLFELAGRKVIEKDENGKPKKYNLSYTSHIGRWTLKEGYELWRQKFSK